ncbi:SIMPL domain-containing protein [Pseudonocardia phyllosphaerae]|uniref:SIMPL domain-containing protein n=1 Tax=Pseudonocardia phyllosphaerae TaxID=3390502 RepID=UPI00397C790E
MTGADVSSAATPGEPVVIRVRGRHEQELPAERGTAQVLVAAQGPEPDPVRAEVQTACAALVDGVRALHDPDDGPVRHYVVEQVRSRVEQPRHEGRPQPPVFHASVSVSVEFDDVTRLGTWISGLGPHAQVQGIGWDLSREHRREAERAARQDALREAVQRAQDYADALGLGPVAPRSVADTGLLGRPGTRAVAARAMAAPAEPEGLGPLLTPDDITVHAEVEAEFVVPGP